MASPQRPDPNRRPADYQDLENRGLRSRGSGGGWFAWWWVWLFIIICAIWFAGWGWGGYGGWWWGNRGAGTAYDNGYATGGAARTAAGTRAGAVGTTANANMISGPGVAVLAATDKGTYVGKHFDVNDAVVTKKVNDGAIWIAENNNNGNAASMLVVLQGAGNNAANANLAQGDRVDVTGTVEKAPAATRAKHEWKLSGNGQKRLTQEGAYIAATQVRRSMNGNGMNGAGANGAGATGTGTTGTGANGGGVR